MKLFNRGGSPFRYIIRYLIDPHFAPEHRIDELVAFCRASRVEEVMMFIAAEELSKGHPTEQELADYIALGRRLKHRLAEAGVQLSLNPWSTTHHNSRGRSLREGQAFRLMVGDNGVESPVTVCPLCEQWQAYLSRSFARMAAEIEPVALWIEDDWRLRNHDAALGWGGCFCEAHLERFSRLVGCTVTREALLEAVVAPGPPHPWRSVWLDLSRETLLEPLGKLSAAIREASPETRVGLMSSNPDHHATEGRDWHRFQIAVGTQPAFLSRPNMGPYTQSHALQSPPSIARMTMANLKGNIEVYPELENSPRCGPYSKSRAFSIWQMLHSACIGACGITINHYDMLGNGISLDPDFGRGLLEAKPMLNALRDLEIDDREAHGVQVLFSPESARHLDTAGRQPGMAGLSQRSGEWSMTCFVLGIAHSFSHEITARAEPVFVNEQTLRAFSDAELRLLLKGYVVLDAGSVEVLVERGFGAELGVEKVARRSLSEAGYAYEQIELPGFSQGPVPFPRMTAQRCAPWLLEMEAAPEGIVLSTVRNFTDRPMWPGALYYENALGGRVLSLTYPLNGEGQFLMGFFNVYRKDFMQKLLFRYFPGGKLACVSHPALHVYRAPTKAGVLLAALNPTDDPVETVEWLLSSGELNEGSWQVLANEGVWRAIEPERVICDGVDRLRFPWSIAPLKGAFFHLLQRG